MILRRKTLLAAWDRGYADGRAGKVILCGGLSTERDTHTLAIVRLFESVGYEAGRTAFNSYCRNVAIRAGLGTDEVIDDIRAEATR